MTTLSAAGFIFLRGKGEKMEEQENQNLEDINLEETEKEQVEPLEDPEEEAQLEEEQKEEPEPQKEPKGEKRFNKLVAKLKEKDEELADARTRILELESEVAKEHNELIEKYDLTYKGESVIGMNEKQFRKACLELYKRKDLDEEEIDKRVEMMENAREKFSEAFAPMQKDIQEVNEEAEKLWISEWKVVEEEILAINPDLSKYTEDVNKAIQNASKLTIDRLKRGPVEKFKFAMRVLEKYASELEKEAYEKEEKSATFIGKGQPTPSKEKKQEFTRAQIEKMSLDEYIKNEAAIDEALKKGKIK